MDFKATLSKLNLPTTEAEITEAFKAEVKNAGAPITNDSAYSPFWRLVTTLITKPTLAILQFLMDQLLPNTFVATASGDFLDTLGQDRGVSRKNAAKAIGQLTFYRDTTVGEFIIPAGIRAQSAPINGQVFEVVTTAPLSFIAGQDTAMVTVEAVAVGQDYNLSTGYYAILPKPVTGIIRVSNEDGWLLSPGADIESDDDYRQRIRDQFGLLADYHVDSAYRRIITEFPGVHSDNVYFQHDDPRGPAAANAYILLDTGSPSPTFIAEINDHINSQGHHGHGDDLQVFAMPITGHSLAFTVYLKDHLSLEQQSQRIADIEQYIRCAFRENDSYNGVTKTKPLAAFSFSRLTAELHAEFADIDRITHAMVDIVSGLNVPAINSLAITQGA